MYFLIKLQICLHEQGIWNLSSESGNLGTMVVSNVRVVWYADINEAFNVSMPYITIESVRVLSFYYSFLVLWLYAESFI